MRVADQVDLAGPRQGQDVFHLGQQLLAPHLGAVGCGHLRHIHLGAALAKRIGNAIEVVDAQYRVKTEKPVHQHDGMPGSGVPGLRLGWWAHKQQGGGHRDGQALDEASKDSSHGCLRCDVV